MGSRLETESGNTSETLPLLRGKIPDPGTTRFLNAASVSVFVPISLVLVLALCAIVAPTPVLLLLHRPPSHTSIVATSLGSVHGTCANETCRWLNVPFAEPFARFERSAPRTSPYPTAGVGSGTEYGPACIQFVNASYAVGLETGRQSEDCLNLDIYAPHDSVPRHSPPLPVMVFLHGGGFLLGSSGQNFGGFTYDGSHLASHDVIVAVVQYRLGPLGFLPRSDGTGGANGIGDQISALRWVARHIDDFGGDPGAVTVFGESAGSVSACILAHLPAAKGLFRRVVAESGVCYESGDVVMDGEDAGVVRETFMDETGFSEGDLMDLDASAIRDVTLRTFDPDGRFMPLFVTGVGQPSVDGDIFPDLATRLSPLPGVDLLHGYNSGEVKMIAPGGIPTGGALPFFTSHLGDRASAVLDRYGPHTEPTTLIADACLRCQSVRFARRVASTPGSKAYFYVYDNPRGGSFHAAELPAVFGTAEEVDFGGEDLETPGALVRRVQRIWTDFAKGEDLGDRRSAEGKGLRWPRVRDGPAIGAMVVGVDMSVGTIRVDNCKPWEDAESAIGGLSTARMCGLLFPE